MLIKVGLSDGYSVVTTIYIVVLLHHKQLTRQKDTVNKIYRKLKLNSNIFTEYIQ